MNRHPLNPVTPEDIASYQRDGVVCLRKVFDQDWVDMLQPIALEAKLDRGKFGLLPTISSPRFMTRTIPEFRRYTFESPLGEVCGKILQSREIRFFFDEVFAKAPASTQPTIWHSDRAGWPVVGQMVPSLWAPLTPISKVNSLECIAGSHRHDRLYWLFSPNARKMLRPDDRPIQPDGEALRSIPEVEFLSWEMEPGDLLVIHPWTLHYSSGNPSDAWRVAISSRVFGDDIRWEPRPDCNNLAGVSFDEMIPGEKPQGSLFPVIYSEAGEIDSGDEFPRGFATAWTPDAYERLAAGVATSARFDKILEREGGATDLSLEELLADIRRAG
jgi:ectoine hydroxylase-related dioxygenase (phytanoyl-CoA dioxygenase family)